MQALNELNDLVFRRLEDIKSPDQAFKLTAELVPLFQFKDKSFKGRYLAEDLCHKL